MKKEALEQNMPQILKYFLKNPHDLTEIAKIVDENIDDRTKWAKNPMG